MNIAKSVHMVAPIVIILVEAVKIVEFKIRIKVSHR